MSDDKETASNTQSDASNSSESNQNRNAKKEDTLYYRVNRLGREIFVGNKSLLITAIQSRRVRGDDLIFDESSDTWGFARKHPVFLEATGQGIEEVKRAQTKQSKWGKWIRFLINAGLIGVLLYLMINYSKTIEFKLGDGESDFQNMSASFSPSEKSMDSSEGAGDGDGDGDGGEDSGDEGYAEINALLQKEEENGLNNGKAIEQIFDLHAEGMMDNRILFEEASTLSDLELLKKSQRVSSEITQRVNTNMPTGKAMYNKLQEAQAIASFVSQRNLTLQNKDHRGANTIIAQLRSHLHRVCAMVYGEEFCRLKKKHPNWKETILLAIIDQEILYGMIPEQVELSWGRASKIIRERGGYRHCYGSGCERSVWLFDGQVRELGREKELNNTKRKKRKKRKKRQR